MNTKLLLIVTAVLEMATGGTLLSAPSLVAELLLGTPLGSPGLVVAGRVAGAGLFSLGMTCWLKRERGRSGARSWLIVGLFVYNTSVPVLLGYAAIVENRNGIALWPASGLHAALAIWCVACLRSGKGEPR